MMQEVRRKKTTVIGLRAAAPKFGRVLALIAIFAGIVLVGVSYYRNRNNKVFRLLQRPAQLSTEVRGIVEGYERQITKGGRPHILLRASREITYTDGHHELEDVHLEVYPETGDRPNTITARRTISNEDNSLIAFTGDVNVETHDHLMVKSEALDYDVKAETGIAKSPLTFERENVRGRADTAVVDAKNKKLELNGGVEITIEPDKQNNGAAAKLNPRSRPVTIKSARADFNQATMRLVFSGGAIAEQERDRFSGDVLSGTLSKQKQLRHIEGRGNSYLVSMNEGRAAEVHSVNMDFFFDSDQLLQRAIAAGDVRARTLNADAEVELKTAGDLNVDFAAQNEQSVLKEMRVAGRSTITLAAPKSRANDTSAANKRLTADEVKLFWRVTGRDLERVEAKGNAELLVDPVQQTPFADRKILQAPRFDGEFYESDNLARIFTATGGARAIIEPVQPTETRAARTLTAQKMIANFARLVQAIERIEAIDDAKFSERERTLIAQKMTASFAGDTQSLSKVEAIGDVKFNERDRSAQAATAAYTAGDEVVKLRGGEPVVWDARARMKAAEIDSDLRQQISYGRGGTSTTYYSQEQTNGATPFAKVKSPVFIVASNAEFRHETGIGIYTGAARAWQDDNFVKADRITLRRETKRFEGEGRVESVLYQARRKDSNGDRSVVAVFASAERMFYSDADRLLHYEGSVDIKQGTERITGEVADVHLLKDIYEVERTVAQRNVVLTQPGKRGTGDWAQYTAADETMVLTGAPARVEDDVQGSSESRRLTVYLRESRVVSDGGENRQTTSRVRSTHRVRKQ